MLCKVKGTRRIRMPKVLRAFLRKRSSLDRGPFSQTVKLIKFPENALISETLFLPAYQRPFRRNRGMLHTFNAVVRFRLQEWDHR